MTGWHLPTSDACMHTEPSVRHWVRCRLSAVPAWSRLRAYAVQPSRGDEDSDDEVPLYDDQPQLRRLVSDARPLEGVAEARLR